MAKEVKVYVTQYCPYCHAAKKLLDQKGVKYESIDVSADSETRNKLVELSGQQTVPQIFADGKSIGGYQELAALYQSGGSL